MPYVISTRGPAVEDTPINGWPTTRRAVGTLDEAQDTVREAVDRTAPRNGGEDWTISVAQFAAIDKSGGTVGPLPDGTVIVVREMTYEDIYAVDPAVAEVPDAQAHVDAFNAAQQATA